MVLFFRNLGMGDGMDHNGRHGRARWPAVLLRRAHHRRVLRRLAHAKDHNATVPYRNAYSGNHYEKHRFRQL